MELPRLKVLQSFKKETSCNGLDTCKDCDLYVKNDGRCSGCTSGHRAEMKDTNFEKCFGECHSCTGYKVQYTAVCCRSPLKNTYMTAVAKGTDWNNPSWKFTKRERLSFKNKAVFYVSSGGVNTIAPGSAKLIEDQEVVAVNLTRVWGSNGFYSGDLKDYLHLPKKTKLVLMTMTMDDLLERAWKHELYAEPEAIEEVGVDYWMPVAFSAYPYEGNMHQYYQFLRTMLTTERSKSWFVSGDYFLRSVKIDDLVLQALEKIPQVVFNSQFLTTEHSLRWHLNVFRWYHKLAPKETSFWFVGATTPTALHNIRKVCGDRDLYFVSAKMLYLASKGQELLPNGKTQKSHLPKIDLVRRNQESFTDFVKSYSQR